MTVSERERVQIRQCMRIPEVQILLEKKVLKKRVKDAILRIQSHTRGFL